MNESEERLDAKGEERLLCALAVVDVFEQQPSWEDVGEDGSECEFELEDRDVALVDFEPDVELDELEVEEVELEWRVYVEVEDVEGWRGEVLSTHSSSCDGDPPVSEGGPIADVREDEEEAIGGERWGGKDADLRILDPSGCSSSPSVSSNRNGASSRASSGVVSVPSG